MARVALGQTDDRMALAQGLIIGPALWGLIVSFVSYALPGHAGAALGWGITVALGAILAWRSNRPVWPAPRMVAGFILAALALFWAALASRQLITVTDPYMSWGWRPRSGRAVFRRSCPGALGHRRRIPTAPPC